MPPVSVSSGPRMKFSGRSTTKKVSDRMYSIGASVFTRSVWLGPTKRRWVLPRVTCGLCRPQSKRGRSTTRMRGVPPSTRTRRISVSGRKVRLRLQKRGAKSLISMPWPWRSYRRVRRMAVLGS